jgi:hypothetical protein|tara:strand:- start:104 stop:352 length:249 start_codon:yes stop_codon:yes gene_type:complete
VVFCILIIWLLNKKKIDALESNMKNIVLAAVLAVSATTVFADGISNPLMDAKVVASTIEEVSGPSKGWFIPLLIITIGLIGL